MTTDYRALCAELLNSAEELEDLMQSAIDGDYMPDSLTLQPIRLCFERARAALAQPEPVGPTLNDIVELCADHEFILGVEGANEEESAKGLLEISRAVLARWGRPAITPIPLSERLPEAGDCDEDGFCWWFSAADPTVGAFGVAACWVLRKHEPDDDDWRSHWLPAHSLPLPPSDHL